MVGYTANIAEDEVVATHLQQSASQGIEQTISLSKFFLNYFWHDKIKRDLEDKLKNLSGNRKMKFMRKYSEGIADLDLLNSINKLQ